MDMPKELEERIGEIELVLKRYLPKEEGHQKTVLEAMNYSLLAGGKRLRPMLMRETYRLFSGESTIIEPFLAAIEMVHTYSLVHDDLPAMDNDEYRRGKKTTHIAYGEAMAILAGDALLNYAYETAAQAFCMAKDGETDRVIQAFSVFANKAGIYGMVGGQTADVESEGAPSISGEAGFHLSEKDGRADGVRDAGRRDIGWRVRKGAAPGGGAGRRGRPCLSDSG